jgi:prepilin-type N-terminal cleavage/methylation domain-containing protein/prepilin-type processing-associated H-X9-DG protein
MKSKKAFTLVELLVVIAIIALLLSILVPALSKAKKHAQRLICASNQRQIVVACETYASTYGGWYPVGFSGSQWMGVDGTLLTSKFVKSDGTFQCPSDNLPGDFGPWGFSAVNALGQTVSERTRKNYRTYGYNMYREGWVDHKQGSGGWRKTGEAKRPQTTIYISETPCLWSVLYMNSYCVYVGPAPPNLKTSFGRTSGYSHWPGSDIWYKTARNSFMRENGYTIYNAAAARISYIHDKGCNYGFADGHAEYIVLDLKKEWPPFDWFDNGLYKDNTYPP